MAEGIKVGSMEEPLKKKKRRKALASQKRRTVQERVSIWTTKMSSRGLGRDESIRRKVVPSIASSRFDGGADDMMVLLLKSERLTETLEEPMPRANELEEDHDEDNVPLAWWTSSTPRRLCWRG